MTFSDVTYIYHLLEYALQYEILWITYAGRYTHSDTRLPFYGTCKPALCLHLDVILGFLREVDEIYAILGYYAAYSDDSLPVSW